MKITINKIILFFILFNVGSTFAQSTKGFSEIIIGSWNGTGTLFGQKATFSMKWENELNAKFIKLTFENRFKDKSGMERVMKANAYYHMAQNKGHWFDSRGVMLPLILEVTEHSMTVLWGNENSEKGKTIYSITDEKNLIVQDSVFKDNAYQPFGEAKYRRLKE